MKKKIGILYICTGEYWKFWENFHKSCEKNLLIEEEKHYFIFTDNKELLNIKDKRIHPIFQEKMEWPYPTLLRFNIFLKSKDKFEKMDYLIFCNANLLFLKPVKLFELFSKRNMFSTLHPGYFNKSISEYPYEMNSLSLAFQKKNENSRYYCGGFNGGTKSAFLHMCEELDSNISIDLEKNIIAIWHDESHFNCYVANNSSLFNSIDASFCYPENRNLKIEKRIVVLDKDNVISIKHKGFIYTIRYHFIKKTKAFMNYIKDSFV